MKILLAAALALGILGAAPATAQVSRETTVRERPDGTVVRRTVTRRSEVRRTSYGPRRMVNRRVCSVKYRNGNRIRTCRTVRRYR